MAIIPIYEYRCPQGHIQEDFTHMAVDAPSTVSCRRCGQDAGRIPSIPATMESVLVPGVGRVLGNRDTKVTGAKNVWGGTGLEDTDGKNRVHYKSDKPFMDMGRGATSP